MSEGLLGEDVQLAMIEEELGDRCTEALTRWRLVGRTQGVIHLNPHDVLAVLAEVGRLRADLAECRRRLKTIYDLVEARLILAALSAGGGDPTREGNKP